MMKKYTITISFILGITLSSASQVKVGGSGAPASGVMLELESSNKGFVPPRIDLTNLTMGLNGSTPVDGMIIYSTNQSTGLGLYVWHSGSWNKLLQEYDIPSRARFKARATDVVGTIEWDPVFMKQRDDLLPMWSSVSPGRIYIRKTGLYLISGSYRKDEVFDVTSISFRINDDPNAQFTRYFNRNKDTITATYTTILYLNAGNYLTMFAKRETSNVEFGAPNTILGTSQMSISEIPLTSY